MWTWTSNERGRERGRGRGRGHGHEHGDEHDDSYVEVDGDGDNDNDNDDEDDDDDGDNDNNIDNNYDNDNDNDDDDDDEDDAGDDADDADDDRDHDDDDDDADGLWNAWHQSSDKPCPTMTEILGGSQRTSCSWWILRSEWRAWPRSGPTRTWIILGLEADNTLKSIVQIRWQAIVQTKVNIIIIWWTVTYNGITWQWRKIALYDPYIQVEQFSLLATAKLIYWTSAWKFMSADH